MATNVTVTESHVNDRQYAGGDNYYSFTSVVNEGDVSAGVEWLGDTPNAIGTYAGESTIKANEELLFDGSTLYPDASGNVALGKVTETFTEIHVANLYATAGIFYDYVYIADLSTAIAKDVSNNMTFTDVVTGTKTLAELAAGNTYTFESGLTESANTVTLGGALTGDAIIELGIYSFEVQLASLDTWFVVADEEVSMYTTDGSDVAELDIYPNEIYLHAEDATTNEASFSLFQDGTIDFIFTKEYMVTDNSATKYGIQYAADYTATFLSRSLVDKGYVDAAVGGVVGMVYPGAGIALSTGSAWGTSIANNSTDWDTAYTHSQIVTGNPHVIGYADIADFNTGVSTYETSHSDVVVDGDFAANGILRRSAAGTYTSLTGSSAVDSVESTLTNDNTHLPTSGAVYAAISAGMVYPGAGIPLSTGSAWGTSITNNSANWNTAYGWGDHAGLYDATGTAASAVSSHESTYNHANYNTAYGWGDHSGLYDAAGTAASAVSTHESTYNHTNYNTAYTHSTLTTGNPHDVAWTELTGLRSGISLSGFDDDLDYNEYTHPNHTGHIVSFGDGATVLTVDAIIDQVSLTTGLAPADELLVSDAGVIKKMDISVIQEYMQDNLAFEAELWVDNGTSLSPASSNHDILLRNSDERLIFGDGDSYIYESGDDTLTFVAGGTATFAIAPGVFAAGGDLVPTTTGWDIGISGVYFDNLYINKIFVETNSSTIQQTAGGDLEFYSTAAGTVTLASLAAGTSPLTTKGDIYGFSTVAARIPVGANGEYLRADSSEATGVAWDVVSNTIYDTTLTDNSTTNIVVGDTTNNRAITVQYSMVRGSDYRTGEIVILNSGGVITDDGGSYFGDSCGMTLATDASSGDIRLKCTLTSTGNNATFEYVLIYPDYSTSVTGGSTYTHPNHSGEVTSVADGAQTLTVSAITNRTALTSGLASTDELLLSDSGTLKRMDVSVLQTYMQSNLSFGTGVWTKSSTNLSPTTAGDDILMPSGDKVQLGASSAYLSGSGGNISVYTNSSLLWTFGSAYSYLYGDLIPQSTNKTRDLGSTTRYWDNLYIDRVYVDNAAVYIDVNGTNMSFTDSTGTYLLSALGGAGGGGDVYKTGTPLLGQLAAWTNSATIEGISEIVVDSPSSNWISFNVTGIRYNYLSGGADRLTGVDSDGDLKIVNLTGHVTTSSTMATTLTVSAITGQTALTSGLASTDELLLSDSGVIKRMDVSVLEAYMQANLSFGGGGGGDVFVSGTPTVGQFAAWTNSTTIEGISEIKIDTPSAGWITIAAAGFRITALAGGADHLIGADSDGDLKTVNLTGHVTTSGTMASTVTVSAITGQTALTSGLASADELLVSDGGVIKRMDISVLETYMQNNLSFGSGAVSINGTPANNQVAVFTNSSTIEGQAGFLYDNTYQSVGVLGNIFSGDRTSVYDSSLDHAIVVASTGSSEVSGIEIVGNYASNTTVGALSFHNTQATQTDKTIAKISAERYNNNSAGKLVLSASNSSGTLMTALEANYDNIVFYSNNSEAAYLDADGLYPISAGNFDLGDNTDYYGNLFVNNARFKALSGGGTQMATIDNDGDIGATTLPSGPGIGTVLGVLWSNTTDSVYSTGAESTIITAPVTNAEYEGSYDGSRLYRIRFDGYFESDGNNNRLLVKVKLGSTQIYSIETGNVDISGSYECEIMMAAISSSNTLVSMKIHYMEGFSGTMEYKSVYPVAQAHGTGDNIIVTVDHEGGTTNPQVFVYHSTVEVLEES